MIVSLPEANGDTPIFLWVWGTPELVSDVPTFFTDQCPQFFFFFLMIDIGFFHVKLIFINSARLCIYSNYFLSEEYSVSLETHRRSQLETSR